MPTTLLRVFVVVTLLVSCVRQNQGQQSSLTDVPIAITHATVIDATGAPAQRDMTVIVANRTITGVGKSSSVAIPEGAVTIDARGKFLIPGLWDMHVHEIFGDWIPEEEKITPALFVLNGVTGVRDMGGDLEPLKKWRSRIAAGEAFLRADAEKTGMPLERDVESVVNSVTKLWNAAPLPELQENCDAMLTQLREGPDGE